MKDTSLCGNNHFPPFNCAYQVYFSVHVSLCAPVFLQYGGVTHILGVMVIELHDVLK